MRATKTKKWVKPIVAACLLTSVIPVSAANAADPAASQSSTGSGAASNSSSSSNSGTPVFVNDGSIAGRISLTNRSYAVLQQIQLLPNQDQSTVSFSVTVHNGDSSAINFYNYGISVKAASGESIKARYLNDLKDKKIAPGATKTFTYYAQFNSVSQLSDLTLQLYKWDFSQDNFERVIGKIAISSAYSTAAASGSNLKLSVNNASVSTSIGSYRRSQNDAYYNSTVTLRFTNDNNSSVTIPALQYAIQTPEGDLYPLTASSALTTLGAKDTRELKLGGSIPMSAAPDHWKLVVSQTAGAGSTGINFKVAEYTLGEAASDTESDANKDFSFTTSSGVYHLTTSGVYRLPWDNDDLLTANLLLTNLGTSTKPVPNLSGYFLLDHSIRVDAKLVPTSSISSLSPTSPELRLQLSGKVPYSTSYSSIELFIQSTDGSNSPVDVANFSVPSQTLNVPTVLATDTTILDKTRLSVQRAALYTGTASDQLLNTSVQLENLGARTTDPAKLVAQYIGPDGAIYPATIQEVTNKISPSGKAVINVWGSVPANVTGAGFQLLIGQAVTNGKLSSATDKPDSYINPVAFSLPELENSTTTSTNALALFPYSLSLGGVAPVYDRGTLTFNLYGYTITKTSAANINLDQHKLIFRFDDAGGRGFTYEKAIDVKDFESTAVSSATTLKIGYHDSFKMSFTTTDIFAGSSGYNYSVYEEYQGYRKLIYSTRIN
jgi:hypothetical protein